MKRTELPLPLCCTLIGGLWTICWAMVYRQCELDRTRVPLDHSIPLLPVGLGGGFAAGWALRWLARAWPPLAGVLAPALAAALVGSSAGPFGWLGRDHRLDWSGGDAILRAAGWGAAAGLGLYATGRVVSAARGGSPDAEPGAAADGGA